MMMSEAKFQKRIYGKEKEHNIQLLEMFDPHPEEFIKVLP